MNVRAGPRDADGTAVLHKFNALPEEAVHRALLECCPSRRWADAVAAGRPYASVDALLAASDAAAAGLGESDLRAALAGHPRIGQPAAGQPAREQAGVASADAATRQALTAGNAEYEHRFGHIYLVCAAGRSAAELLSLLRERLRNDRETEWDVVRSELGKINRIRLRRLLEGLS
jgi:2-oxo-4-hydroxy-4-carboxy-5-ureidoimidazoline decarboxylase